MKVRIYDNTAIKFINKQPPKQRQRIMEAIERLPDGDVVAMKNKDNVYRLRIGDYRVTFAIYHDRDEIIIRTVGNRGDVYKG